MKIQVSPEPKGWAWWLRTEFSPVHKEIRGIPVSQLDASWILVSELVKEAIPKELLFEDGVDIMQESKLNFSRTGGGAGPTRTPIPESFEHLIRSYSNTDSGVDSNTFRVFTGT